MFRTRAEARDYITVLQLLGPISIAARLKKRKNQKSVNPPDGLPALNQSAIQGVEMSKLVRILGIAGRLRRESYNRAALREATKLLPENATLDIFDLDGIPRVQPRRRTEPAHQSC